jgi:hypothetical protein
VAANLDKVVKPEWAAKVLGIDYCDLPKLDRPWTKRVVGALRDERPQWLTEARRRHAARAARQWEERIAQLDVVLTRLGYNDPDLGTVDQAVLYIDGAVTHLMTEVRCAEGDAEAVAWRRWPKSMSAEEDYVDADWRD